MEKVLVTGATGFLGEYVVRRLTGNYEVYALGRNAARGKELEALGAIFCQGDFTDEKTCRDYFAGIDYVIHAGALSTPWGDWRDFYRTNVTGTTLVGKLCCQYGVRRLVYISSPSIYTEKQDRYQIREDQYDRENQLNGYIKSKILAEQQVHEFEQQGLETVILRPRGLVGIGDTSLVPRLLRANQKTGIPLFNQGQNQVDLTSVENVALACELAMTKAGVSGQVFNITNGEPMEFGRLLEEFLIAADETPRYRKLPFGLVYSLAAVMETVYRRFSLAGEPPLTRYTVCTLGFAQTMDISRAQELLGYHPEKTLAESVAEYGAWWRKHKNGDGGEIRRPGQIESVKVYHCGFCINNLRHVFRKHKSEKRQFPASAAAIRHKKYGTILFDTGYSEQVYGKGVFLWLYRTLNPVVFKQTDRITEKLKADGIDPGSLKRFILSHGHPDHIGGLGYFQGYQLITTGPVFQTLKRPALKNLVLKQLMPRKGAIKKVKILSQPADRFFLNDYFDTIYDVFGDGSIYGIVLDGHSKGQLGLWLPDMNLLLAADACWGRDLLPVTKRMRWIGRRIQNNFGAYKKTASQLERLQQDYPQINIVFAHQQGEEQIYDRSTTGT